MKRISFVLVLLIGGFELVAQQQYFVFIQESKGQPFYVRIKEDSHSSSAIGHIILPQLKDSVYSFFIGFPKDRYGEQLFMIAINRKDHGYELRNLGGGRYKLYDLLTQQLIEPISTEAISDQTIKKTDTYSELMADVVKDSAVLYTSAQDTMSVDSNTVVKKAEVADNRAGNVAPKSDSVNVKTTRKSHKKESVTKRVAKEASENDSLAAKTAAEKTQNDSLPSKTAVGKAQKDSSEIAGGTDSASTTAGNNEQVARLPLQNDNMPARDRRDIIRLSTENVQEGKLMIFVDRTGAVSDTIRLVIPRKL
jgi:hypothetical protein